MGEVLTTSLLLLATTIKQKTQPLEKAKRFWDVRTSAQLPINTDVDGTNIYTHRSKDIFIIYIHLSYMYIYNICRPAYSFWKPVKTPMCIHSTLYTSVYRSLVYTPGTWISVNVWIYERT